MSGTVPELVPLHELPEESRLVVRCASDIKPEKVDWLWHERLPLGKCVLVAGEGGLGKSMALVWIAATVSRGKEWPLGEGRSRSGSVIILSAEDDAADTIVPRLIAADADRSKVHILEAVRRDDGDGHRSFNLQLDLPELEKKIEQLDDVSLVIIDPITSYLGMVDSHKNADIRSVLEPLGRMAANRHLTVIANTHLSKASGGNANSRVIGSVAFVNHARAAFIVTADPNDNSRRLFIPSKTNLGRSRDGLAYRIADQALPGPDGLAICAPYVKWEDDPVTISADEAMAALAGGADSGNAAEEAKEFLLEVLRDGPESQKEVKQQAVEAGLAWSTVRKAKKKLAIKADRVGGIADKGRWVWRLPNKPKMSTSDHGPLNHLSEADSPNVPKASNLEAGHLRESRLDDDFEERAAILEHEAGLSRTEAEAQAAEELPDLPDFLDR
jgi:putative DNA primase/helicase